MRNQVFKFAIVGGIGFLVDAGILSGLFAWTDWGPFWPRAISFPIALTVTWYLNSIWTFKENAAPVATNYSRYAVVQSIGVTINYVVYTLAILLGPLVMSQNVILPLALASVAGMSFNFLGSKYWAFRRETLPVLNDPLQAQTR